MASRSFSEKASGKSGVNQPSCYVCGLKEWRGQALPLEMKPWYSLKKPLCPNCAAVQAEVEVATHKMLEKIKASEDIPLLPYGSNCPKCNSSGLFNESGCSLHLVHFICSLNPEHGSWLEER